MPAVVSDTTVISNLAAVGQAVLLRIEFGTVFVPPAVWRELHARTSLPGAAAADSARESGWLVVQTPKPSETFNQLLAELDSGEAEAIALAYELKPATVLLDETDGRAEARRLGLATIGTVGILAGARQSGQLQKIKPLLDRLMRDFRFPSPAPSRSRAAPFPQLTGRCPASWPDSPAEWRRSSRRLETEFFPAGAREQAVRAEEVLVQAPALVRAGGETAREQVPFVLAQAGFAANFSQDRGDFFSMMRIYLKPRHRSRRNSKVCD
jgi:hypothetical protein